MMPPSGTRPDTAAEGRLASWICTTPGPNTCHSSRLGLSSNDWPGTGYVVDNALEEASGAGTEDVVNNALEEAFISSDDELEPCDWPGTEDVVDNALEEASVSLDDELEPCSVELMDGLFDSPSESPFSAEAFMGKSEPPLVDDEFMPTAFKAEVVVVTTDMLESKEFVVTAMVVIAELVVTPTPEVVKFSVLALMARSPVVVFNKSVASVLGEVDERIAAPLEELEE